MAADVVLTDQARKDILDLKNAVIAARLWKLVDRLKNWPDVSGVKSLTGNLAGKYRIRTGDYRIQFRVEGQSEPQNPAVTKGNASKLKRTDPPRHRLIIEKVGHRDGFYED
jgi:mRNA-degrading endonuclease RelE of RelBE toxin-antitoxin system